MWRLLRPDERVHSRSDDNVTVAHLLAANCACDLIGELQRIGHVRLGPLPLAEHIERDAVDVLYEPLVADTQRFSCISPPHEFPKQVDTTVDTLLERHVAVVNEYRATDRRGIDRGEHAIDRRCIPDESLDKYVVHRARWFATGLCVRRTTEHSDGWQGGDDGLQIVVVACYRA